ncbi:TetR/AcrR family transcriptional regulator [Devriesea agamarum]|uniref:TetR/AcrR family transcriptional regulator n=1 Tax=Devriesea agamarum TaxID=472569 RepID=UPI00071E41D5|nr:TetR/AcrR family transcriptional regulator [Devriesea agamarum]
MVGETQKQQNARVGRPRKPATDASINDAVLALLAKSGYAGLTFHRVATQAKVTRPTVYRRANSKVALVVNALIDKYGIDPVPDTGGVREDLLALQQSQVRLYTDRAFQEALPGVLVDIRSDPAALDSWVHGFVKPRRLSVASAVERGIQRGEITADVDVEWVCEVLTGPILSTAFLRGVAAIPEAIVAETVDLVLLRFGQEK